LVSNILPFSPKKTIPHISKSQGAGTDVVFRIHVRSLVGIHLVGVHEEEIRLAEELKSGQKLKSFRPQFVTDIFWGPIKTIEST